MLQSLVIHLALLFLSATADVVVATVPARGDLTLPLAPSGRVEFKREATLTRVRIEADRVAPASAMGPAGNVYVAWAVSPEGLIENLGEVPLDKDKVRMDAATRFDQAGLLITAEPHYMVDHPSAAVAYRSQNPKEDEVRRVSVAVEVGLFDYGSIAVQGQGGVQTLVSQARAAFEIAKIAEGERYAEAEFRQARVAHDTMNEMVNRSTPMEIVGPTAHETIRRSQAASRAARERKTAIELESARTELTVLRQEKQALESSISQLTRQQAAAAAQIQTLQDELRTAAQETQRVVQERDQSLNRERAVAGQLSDLRKKQEADQDRLVLQLRDDFFDPQGMTLTPTGRDALSRLCGAAEVITGSIRLEGTVSPALIEAARQFLLLSGIAADRIIAQ